MYNNKKLCKLIAASLIVGGSIFIPTIYTFDFLPQITSVAHAEIKTYVGRDTAMFDFGEDDEAIVNTVKAYARARALQNAKEQAGVYMQTYSRSVNGNLTNDEISAITNNIVEEIGETQYKKLPYEAYNAGRQSYGKVGFMYEAIVTVRIDTDDIKKYLNLDTQARYNVVSQNEALQQSINENNNEFENLRKRAETVSNDASALNTIKTEINAVDNKLLATQRLEEGNRLYYQGDYNGAIAKYNEALQYNPKYADAYYNRGTAYQNLQNYNVAITDYNKAIQLNPNNALAYNNRGVAYGKSGNHSAAIANFNKAIELNPNYAPAYYNRGIAYYEIDNYNAAISDYTKTIQINLNFAYAYNNRGNAYAKIQNYNAAIADYTKAIELNPNDADAYYSRGLAYCKSGNYNAAIADYTKAIQLNPKDAVAYNGRAIAYAMSGNLGEALKDANKLIELNPNDGKYYRLRGIIYQKMNDNVKAQADFAKARQLGSNG